MKGDERIYKKVKSRPATNAKMISAGHVETANSIFIFLIAEELL